MFRLALHWKILIGMVAGAVLGITLNLFASSRQVSIERDLPAFSGALYELQHRVGRCFAGAQGGIYADPLLERIVKFIRSHGIEGVGQSSWGPTLYAVTADEATARSLADHLRARFDLSDREVLVTAADNQGCTVS